MSQIPKFRERFEAIRRADLDEAPSFDRVWRNAERLRVDRPRANSAWVPVIAGVVVVLAAAAYLNFNPFSPTSAGATSLSEWQAPTDAFLDIPGIEWIGTVPALEADLPDLTWDGRDPSSNTSSSRRFQS